MPDIMYLLFIFILMYLCCIPRFDMGGTDATVGPQGEAFLNPYKQSNIQG